MLTQLCQQAWQSVNRAGLLPWSRVQVGLSPEAVTWSDTDWCDLIIDKASPCPSIWASLNLFGSPNTPVKMFPLGTTHFSYIFASGRPRDICWSSWPAGGYTTKRGLFLRSTMQNSEILIGIPSYFSHPKPDSLTVSCIALGHRAPHQKEDTANVNSYRAWHWKSREAFLLFSCKIRSLDRFPGTLLGSAMTTSPSGVFTTVTGIGISLKRSIAVFRWII